MQTSSELVTQQKRARHCNKCPGRPLMLQCAHTKAGREFLAEVRFLLAHIGIFALNLFSSKGNNQKVCLQRHLGPMIRRQTMR